VTAYINYHYTTLYFGRVVEQSAQHPAGMSWGTVKAENCPDDDTFLGSHVTWPSYAWPGGYEIHYYVRDGGVLCHQCANKELPRTLDPEAAQFFIVDGEVNYEASGFTCDHCNRDIAPAYGE